MATQSSSKVHFVTGKGGVGKSVVACAMALAYAHTGRRVLLAEFNGHDRAAAFMGVAPTGYHLTQVFEDFSLVDVNPQDAIREYALLVLKFETLYKAVFENNLVRHFVRLVPALGELTMLGKVWYHTQEQVRGRPRFDAIVVDAPATGHAIALMQAPRAVYDTVPAGPMRDNARLLNDMLTRHDQTSLHVVTTPEDMPVTEALELSRAAEGLDIALGPMVINQRVAPLPQAAVQHLDILKNDAALAGVPRTLGLREGKRQAGETELNRLGTATQMRAISLPRVAQPRLDLPALHTLSAHFVKRIEQGTL